MKIKINDVVSSLDQHQNLTAKKQKELLAEKKRESAQEQTISAVGEAVELIVDFMRTHEPNVSVKNQKEFPSTILTPDVDKVVNKLGELIAAVQSSVYDDATVSKKLDDISKSLRDIPSGINFPEIPKPLDTVSVDNQIDYTNKFDELANKFDNIELSPEIKISPTKVTVDNSAVAEAVDGLKDVIKKAVSGISIPEYTPTDIKPLQKAVEAVTKAIQDRPIVKPSSQVTDKPYTPMIDDYSDANYIYIGIAEPGSAITDPVWQVQRLAVSSGIAGSWADGDALFDNEWNDRTSLTYS